MKLLQRNFYFITAVLALSSCASFENLTDDRTRAEDDEMYWNGKEMFYDNSLLASNSGEGAGDDYYDPNSVTRSNTINGGTNPRATFNPLSGWQLSYGLNAFSNYCNGGGYGMGFGSGGFNNGYGGYGNNGYGYNSYGYNPYSSYNPYGGYGNNSYGYGMGGLGWGGNGYGNGWYGNGFNNNGGLWGGSTGNGETANVTHHHRQPASVGTGNSSTYHRGVLQKSLVQPLTETARTPVAVSTVRANGNSPSPARANPGRTSPNYNSPTYSAPSRSTSTPSTTSPSHSSPSRSTPSHTASPSPSRSTPTHSAPTHSTPSRSTAPSHSASPSHSAPSRSSSPGKRP